MLVDNLNSQIERNGGLILNPLLLYSFNPLVLSPNSLLKRQVTRERIFHSKRWEVTLILAHKCNVKFFQNSQHRLINTLNINWIFIWATSTNFLVSDIYSRIAVLLGVFSAGCLYVVLSNIVETKWLQSISQSHMYTADKEMNMEAILVVMYTI